MTPFTAITLLFGIVFPGCVLLSQCLLLQSVFEHPAAAIVLDESGSAAVRLYLTSAGLMAVAVSTGVMFWLLSNCRQNAK